MLLDELIPQTERIKSKISSGLAVDRISSDSNKLEPKGAFFAIRGHSVDGHRFVSQAFEKGAACAIVEDPQVFEAFEKVILVPSTRKALARSASRLLNDPTEEISLVGVTGTNGKTTTSFLLKELWDLLLLKSGLVGTIEYTIGTEKIDSSLTTPDPVTLQRLFSKMRDQRVTHAAMEVSSIALDQYRCLGCQFDIGVFTNLTQDHLDYHGSFKAYAAAKQKFFRDFGVKVGVFNIDDDFGHELFSESLTADRVSYSVNNPNADFFCDEITFSKQGTSARLNTAFGRHQIHSPLLGKHNLSNLLGAIAAAYSQGLDLEKLISSVPKLRGAPGRLEKVKLNKNAPTVFVDYAHTPDALENVIRLLSDLKTGRLITVFGCGGDRDRSKRPKMAKIASENSEICVLTSDNPRTEDPEQILNDAESGISSSSDYHREVNRTAAIHKALEIASAQDLVLIAGKGHETYQILGTEKVDYDDRQVVREFYA